MSIHKPIHHSDACTPCNTIIAAPEHNGNEDKTLSLSLSIWVLRVRMEPDEFTSGSVIR